MGLFRGVELADLTLSGERLELRPWRADDAERVLEAMQHPSMREFMPLPDPYDERAAHRWLDRRRVPDDAHLDRAVLERSSGRVVGSASLRLAGDPAFGYWIAPDARGHGYAAEAVRVLADWAFALAVPRLLLSCDVRNLASARTALAAGFSFEGIARSAFQGGGTDEVPERRGDSARFARLAKDSGDPIPPAFPPFPDGGLSDSVLSIRPTVPADIPGLLESEDPETVRWSADGVPRPRAEVERRTMRAGLDWLVSSMARCTIVDVATGRHAGDLQVRHEGPTGVAGIGYTVHPHFRGRGYTARALRLLVPWCFEAAGFARVQVGAKRDNIASQRAAASAGFQPDGVRECFLRNADGTYSDEVCFALINPRWRPA